MQFSVCCMDPFTEGVVERLTIMPDTSLPKCHWGARRHQTASAPLPHPQRTPPEATRAVVHRPSAAVANRLRGFPQLDIVDLFCVVCGIFTPFVLDVVGELFVGEILLLIFLIASYAAHKWGSRGLSPRTTSFLILLSALAAGLVLADLIRGTPQSDFLRGWGRVALLAVDITALGLFGRRGVHTLVWFVAGYCLGHLIWATAEGLDFVMNWKFEYGPALTLLGACGLYKIQSRRYRVLLLLIFAAANLAMDFRALAGFCVVAAVVEVLIEMRADGPMIWVVAGVLVCCAAASMMVVLGNEDSQVSARQDTSNYDRLMRMKGSLEAIKDSPLLGYGSWPRSRALAYEYMRSMSSYVGHQWYIRPTERDLIPSHSQFLQAWLESGIFGIPFFAYLFFCSLRSLKKLMTHQVLGPATSLAVILLVMCIWDVLFSPFSGRHRIFIAIAIAFIAAIDRASPAPSPQIGRTRR